MARLARIVIPDVPHHVTQRGNRRLPVFLGDDDRVAYLELVAQACVDQGTRCLAGCLMDDAHLMTTVRCVENNPVTAKLVDEAGDWRWSSARSHLAGRRVEDDPLTDVAALGAHVRNWRALLQIGMAAMDDPGTIAEIEARTRTGRPLAEPAWISEMETRIARKLGPMKRGPKPKAKRV